jgi:type VI protein secretion system component Hcp
VEPGQDREAGLDLFLGARELAAVMGDRAVIVVAVTVMFSRPFAYLVTQLLVPVMHEVPTSRWTSIVAFSRLVRTEMNASGGRSGSGMVGGRDTGRKHAASPSDRTRTRRTMTGLLARETGRRDECRAISYNRAKRVSPGGRHTASPEFRTPRVRHPVLMKQSILILCAIALSRPVHAQPSSSAQYELVVEGIAVPKATLPIESWSWGASESMGDPDPKDADANGVPKKKKREIAVQDFHFVIMQSHLSTMLLEALATKKTLPRVTLRSKQATPSGTLELVMKDVRVSSFQTGGSGHSSSGGTMDQLSLTFKSVKMTVDTGNGKHSADVRNPN